MKIYLAGTSLEEMVSVFQSAQSIEKGHYTSLPPRILLSYHYFKQVSLTAEISARFPGNPDIFLDSGAFSAMTQKISIPLEQYAHYIQVHLQRLTVYANLDVIRNHRATWHNQQELEQKYRLQPLPVFHVCEPWDVLERYLERYRYIALGVAGARYTVYMPWLVKCFKMAHTKAVFHGFGITAWEAMKSFPWYSVDSSSWAVGRFGRVWVFDEKRGSLREGYTTKDARIAQKFGVTASELRERSVQSRTLANLFSVLAFRQAERYLERRWGKIDVPEKVPT